MEAVLFHSSPDHQPISPYKPHIKTTPKRGINRPPFISRQASENFAPILNLHNTTAGLLQAPPPPPYHLSHSYPPFSFQQQPPLLPLPISAANKPNKTNTNPRARGLSCPPVNRKTTNNTKIRDSSLTPKKSKTNIPKKGVNLKPLGPDPKELPKNVPKISSLLSGNNTIISTNDVNSLVAIKDQVGEFSGAVAFTISPPPSSLPLPTFSLRPKLSCNAEAAGVDAGATDNLRRLLRLP